MVGKSTANTKAKAVREKAKEKHRVTRPCVWWGEHLNKLKNTLEHTSKVCAQKQKANAAAAAKGKSGN